MFESPETPPPLISDFADDPDMVELIELFVNELPARVESLQRLFDVDQFDEMRRVAHQIKGAGGGYGFPTLSDAARDLETSLQDGFDTESIRNALDELINLCNRASY